MADYKKAKEAFVSDMKGSTILHINMISFVALCSIALYSALRTRLPQSKPIHLPVAWLILVLPLLLSMTVFANRTGILSILLLLPTALLISMPRRESGTPLPSPTTPPSPRHLTPQASSQITPLPALTIYRAHMLLMTILAILAVDFPVFPRSLAKCETYGVSLMDLGVGSFVFSQGLVSAIPILKNPGYLNAPFKQKFVSVTWKAFPIIVLGLIRVILVKGTEYPEHESEYGTHWNFFITLALLPIMEVILHPLIMHTPLSLIGFIVAIVQQMGLSFMGLQDVILNTPRTNIISANKEGIISLTGYFSVHLFGLSIGTLVLPPSPNFFRRRQKALARPDGGRKTDTRGDQHASLGDPRQNDKTVIELCSYAFVWWGSLGIVQLFGIGGEGASRRMVNLPYILWVVAFNTSFVLGYFLLDLFFFPSPKARKSKQTPIKPKARVDAQNMQSDYVLELVQQRGHPPALLEAINKNGLVIFLLANVATGLVNLTIQTMYTSDLRAMVILSGYSAGISLLAWSFRNWRVIRL